METTINGIKVFESFLSEEDCSELLKKITDEAHWEQAAIGKYENDKVSHSEINLQFRDIEVSPFEDTTLVEINRKLEKLYDHIKSSFQISGFTFGEFMFSKYKLNSHIKPHSDTGIYSTNRLITCVLYLNDLFEGGELYFPDFDYEYKPKKGGIITFWSEYSHGVKKLVLGERYCIVFFARSVSSPTLFN